MAVATDSDGRILDGSDNISDDKTCGFAGTGAQGQTLGDGVSPKLDPGGLANNGGPTQTVAELAGSVSVDAVSAVECGNLSNVDQRGMPRPDPEDGVNGPCDIGAFELQESPSATASATPTATPTATATATASATATATATTTATATDGDSHSHINRHSDGNYNFNGHRDGDSNCHADTAGSHQGRVESSGLRRCCRRFDADQGHSTSRTRRRPPH